MKIQDKKWIRFRVRILAFFFILGLLTVIARTYQLQILERDRLASLAKAGYRGTEKLPPKRGTIYDSDKHELAVTVELNSVYAHPRAVTDKPGTAKKLAKVLGLRSRDVQKKLKGTRSFVWIKRKVPPTTAKAIETLALKGVGLATESKRYYPGKEIAAHIIGFSGDDNQGLEGIEKSYDRQLKGPQQSLVKMQDALGRPFYVSRPVLQEDEMHHLQLTIDKDIQYKAEKSLKAAVKKSRAKSGQCVILDPETGEVLAMAVYPEFNPNVFGRHRPAQWRNRTITDVFEPGSTIKAFLLAAALEEKVVSPRTKFNCEKGKFRVGGHTIHDTKKHGLLTVSEIITLSSNIGAVKIGEKLGYKRFERYLRKLGFGSKTGIELIGDRSGFVRPYGSTRVIDRANLYFGQGMSCTTLQLAAAMGAISNGGRLMRPYVVKALIDQEGRTVEKGRSKTIRRVFSTDTARIASRILEGVVSDEGTAPLAAIAGYPAAGKTGTAQKIDPKTKRYSWKNYFAIFAGYVPANRPKMVIVVIVDEPRGSSYGGVVAGPVFEEVGTYALHHLRINPQVREAEHKGRPENKQVQRIAMDLRREIKEEALGSGQLPDFRGQNIREVMRKGTALGLKVSLEGSGLAVKQEPGPGAPLDEITTVKVHFQSPM